MSKKKNLDFNSFVIGKKPQRTSKSSEPDATLPAKDFTAPKPDPSSNSKIKTKKPSSQEPKKKRTSMNLPVGILARAAAMKIHTGRDVQDITAEALDMYMKKEGF